MESHNRPRSGACAPALCRAIEKAGGCSMRYASTARGPMCTPTRLRATLPARLADRLDECSMCDYHPFVHAIRPAPLPRFPPRRWKNYMCAAERPRAAKPSKKQLARQYRGVRRELEHKTLADCVCDVSGDGNGIEMQGRRLVQGISGLHGLCAYDTGAREVDVRIAPMSRREREGGGGKHMVLPGQLRFQSGFKVGYSPSGQYGDGSDGTFESVVVRAALSRGWGTSGYNRTTPPTLNCSSMQGGKFDPRRCVPAEWAAFRRTCQVHLGVREWADYAGMDADDMRTAGGKVRLCWAPPFVLVCSPLLVCVWRLRPRRTLQWSPPYRAPHVTSPAGHASSPPAAAHCR